MRRFLRRFRQLVLVSGAAVAMTFIAWPRQLDAYAALWSDVVAVRLGAAVTGLAVAVLAVLALALELRRSRRDLDRVRRSLTELTEFSYRPAPWGSRAAR